MEKANFNPLLDPVVERTYTKDTIKAETGEMSAELLAQPIPEPTYDRPIVVEDEAVASPSTGASTSSQSNNSVPPSSGWNPDLQDLDNKQKRKAASKSADAIIETYCKFVPTPFIKLSSFDMIKMEKLDMLGEIDLNMPVQEDGTTVGSYMKQLNSEVLSVFTVSEETKREIKDPLVDVLMEQELSLSPKQRLMIAVGSHIVQMTAATFQLYMSKKSSIETFKEFRAAQGGSTRPAPQPQAQPQQETQSKQEYTRPQMEEEDIPTSEPAIQDAQVQEEVVYEKPDLTMDSYMNDSSISIEEEEN